MEQFPKLEQDTNSIKRTIEKAVLIGAIAASPHATEAQKITTTESQKNTIAVQETTSHSLENQKILSNVLKLEEAIKKQSNKEAKESKVRYAILRESEALQQTSLIPNRIESLLTENIIVDMAKEEARPYDIIVRDMATINAILSEKNLVRQHNPGAEKEVFKTYAPVDSYITIGTKRLNDDTIQITLRHIDLKTKKVTSKDFTYTLKNERSLDEFEKLESQVYEEVHTLIQK